MQTAHPDYLLEINQRIEIYSECLTKVEAFISIGENAEAIVCGLQTIIYCCTGSAEVSNNIAELITQCKDLVDGFPFIDSSKSTRSEISQKVKGILIERKSFYKQLQSLTH